jgi:hypothetical protein
MYHSDGGTIAENVLWCATSSTPLMADLVAIGAAFSDWATEALAPNITNNWHVDGVNLRAMNEEEGISIFYDDGFPADGTGGTAFEANQVAYTVTLSTGLVGRSARGRVYGLGINPARVANGVRLTDVAQGQYTACWESLRVLLEGDGHALQVVSFVDAGVPRAAGRKLPVLSLAARFPIATHRGRLS